MVQFIPKFRVHRKKGELTQFLTVPGIICSVKKRSIVFVCSGNICRSPMAETMLRDMLQKQGDSETRVFSRGMSAEMGLPMTREAIQVLKTAGFTAYKHRAGQLTRQDVEEADHILAMTEDHVAQILAQFPEARKKVKLLGASSIADPYGGSLSDYEKCRIEIQNALLDFITKFKPEGSSKP